MDNGRDTAELWNVFKRMLEQFSNRVNHMLGRLGIFGAKKAGKGSIKLGKMVAEDVRNSRGSTQWDLVRKDGPDARTLLVGDYDYKTVLKIIEEAEKNKVVLGITKANAMNQSVANAVLSPNQMAEIQSLQKDIKEIDIEIEEMEKRKLAFANDTKSRKFQKIQGEVVALYDKKKDLEKELGKRINSNKDVYYRVSVNASHQDFIDKMHEKYLDRDQAIEMEILNAQQGDRTAMDLYSEIGSRIPESIEQLKENPGNYGTVDSIVFEQLNYFSCTMTCEEFMKFDEKARNRFLMKKDEEGNEYEACLSYAARKLDKSDRIVVMIPQDREDLELASNIMMNEAKIQFKLHEIHQDKGVSRQESFSFVATNLIDTMNKINEQGKHIDADHVFRVENKDEHFIVTVFSDHPHSDYIKAQEEIQKEKDEQALAERTERYEASKEKEPELDKEPVQNRASNLDHKHILASDSDLDVEKKVYEVFGISTMSSYLLDHNFTNEQLNAVCEGYSRNVSFTKLKGELEKGSSGEDILKFIEDLLKNKNKGKDKEH